MSTILGHFPSSPVLSTPFARGTHRQKVSPEGKASMTIRLLLHSSSLLDSFRLLRDAVRGWNVANESLDSGSLSTRAGWVGSRAPGTGPEIDTLECVGPGDMFGIISCRQILNDDRAERELPMVWAPKLRDVRVLTVTSCLLSIRGVVCVDYGVIRRQEY